jgi:maleamate amidohydrolase
MRRPLSIAPGKVAALFVDLQEEHRRDRRYLVEGFDRVIANVCRLQETARRGGIPLYHCAYIVDPDSVATPPFHPTLPDGTSAFSDKGDPWTKICPEVSPLEGEPLLIKAEASAFGATSLAGDLRARGIEWLVVAGVWTEACVHATVKDALGLGFRVLLVKDACGSGTGAMHQTAILNLANRLYGGAVTCTETACRLLQGETADAWQVEGAVPLRFTFENAAELYRSL